MNRDTIKANAILITSVLEKRTLINDFYYD